MSDRRFPLWLSNLFVFVFLFLVVLSYFLWQITQAKKAFLEHVDEHAQLVAGVVQLNARGTVFSREVTEKILQSFLGNTARFINYLDSIEPFTAKELSSFSEETGLVGIRIYRSSGESVEGPSQWSLELPSECSEHPGLIHRESEHLYLFSLPGQQEAGCVLIGLSAVNIEAMQKQLSLDHLADTLSELPGICYASIEHYIAGDKNPTAETKIIMVKKNASPVAEVHLFLNKAKIIIGMHTTYLDLSVNRLWRDFIIFSTLLVLLGSLLSFILYRLQSAHLAQARTYERHISKERENAALGRSAASIAHEIRNPLNAIKMGLQRLQIEGQEIGPEHKHLIGLMLDAVRRTNDIVSSLLNYSRPQNPKQKLMRLDLLVQDLLDLYQSQCREFNITVTQNIAFHAPIFADPDLLHQVVENLLKNALEAQHGSGFIHVDLNHRGNEVFLKITNSGFSLPPDRKDCIREPYFTTRTEGTGLGLSISERIIQAHNGHMEVSCPEEGTVEIAFYLPKG